MSVWLSIAEAASLTGLPEDRIRGAVVLGRLRAEPTGNLADYRIRRDDLVRFAHEEGVSIASAAPICCGARLLIPALAFFVILGGLLLAVGVSGFLRCGARAPVAVPVAAPSVESDLHAQFDRLTGEWPDDPAAIEDDRHVALIEDWEAFAASLEGADAAGIDLMRHVAERNLETLKSSVPRR